MSSCCGPTGSTEKVQASELCPSCGAKGTNVDPITLKALLTPEGLRRGVPPAPRYCATAACTVVYFDNGVPVLFHERDLTVPVYAKLPERDDVPVCYCFGHTSGTVREEIMRGGTSTATKTITAEVKAGRCACEVKNPRGTCCLGDVARVERRVISGLILTTS